ncbi:MAG: flagellar assembly protein FliW [Nitrospirae bacterium]|nr:flagellar assembly protein FliW [Nitrospirota bacterium]
MYSNDKKVIFETSRFGQVEVDSDKVITFPDGIVGFPSIKRYVLLDHNDTVVRWLHAIDDPDVAFIVVEPMVLVPDFKLTLDPTTKRYLKLEDAKDLVILVIIRVENERVIANFHGPLLFNASIMLGVQVVLDKI